MQHELPKPYITLGDKPILAHTLSKFLALPGLIQIVVATSAEYLESAQSILNKVVPGTISQQCVEGGAERQHSIRNALKAITDVDLVLVHDAVRPFVTRGQIERCCRTAENTGAAVLGVHSRDTIKKVDANGFVNQTPDRSNLWQVQTPQVFKAELLKGAYAKAEEQNYRGTDDASLVEWSGEPVKMVEGSSRNIKLTYPHDLAIAKMFIEQDNDE